jgi:hypothetical protein
VSAPKRQRYESLTMKVAVPRSAAAVQTPDVAAFRACFPVPDPGRVTWAGTRLYTALLELAHQGRQEVSERDLATLARVYWVSVPRLLQTCEQAGLLQLAWEGRRIAQVALCPQEGGAA